MCTLLPLLAINNEACGDTQFSVNSLVYICSLHRSRPGSNCVRKNKIGSKTLKRMSFLFHD